MAAAAVVVYIQWKKEVAGTGLFLAYLLNFWLIHWPGAAIYLLPWYSNRDLSVVEAGFQQTTYAVIAFAVGSIVLAPFCRRVFWFAKPGAILHKPNLRLAQMYIVVGLVCYAVLEPLLGRLPTITALVSTGWTLIVVGLALSCWQAWQQQRHRVFLAWLGAGLSLPLFTLINQGFVASGVTATLAFLAFVATIYRSHWWKLLLVGLLTGYLGLSFYVSYMRDRQALRDVIWGGQTLGARLDRLAVTMGNFEWFDPYDVRHLSRIDDRMNQNHLVGSAVHFLNSGAQDFAYGDTLWNALQALVPRVLWPDKPIVAGSGNLVATYTGLVFEKWTSVGIGHVMEFYINFGALGVVIGFLAIGTIITIADWSAWELLQQGDWERFTFWYLPSLSLLNVNGSLVEVTASAASAVIIALLMDRYWIRRAQGRKPQPLPEQLALPSSPILGHSPRR